MFTQPCFIRKNTPYLRDRLKKLGYKPFLNDMFKLPCLATNESGLYFQTDANRSGGIKCFNEELFFAIAALRDDSDYMQWFTDGDKWILWDLNTFNGVDSCLCFGMYEENEIQPHKATVKELIEHFK